MVSPKSSEEWIFYYDDFYILAMIEIFSKNGGSILRKCSRNN